ncbi:50S ribosomal protein L3 N(5)-glutamine methyltransferase [Massilia sp. IC2-477]|uniref:50S ribosomal protein L3 N(5)-glutamine methyltransferase n=1 Tax=Massilia sp. IC2-477 TaxID=2887198 RepID=UPI001D128A22|nr:50S ribosomal protein L3 N(5)-glutamine methyltransferase [Massilia sp. IC2-477]MCC2958583.1 50S ribosomal protein L3 N(5)-glutamine methyltransferase [Massilia sp. IC2-477]
MTNTTFSTPRDLLRYAITRFNGAKLFFGHGSAEAFDEAAYLVLHTLKLPLDRLDPFLDARLLPEEVIQVMEVIERRVTERVPAAYITKEAWLGEYRFYVDERVLVPRSFIAELIPQTFAPWVQDPDAVENVLELCTGSGCLAIMMADAFPNAVVDAVDISKDALAVAEHNIREYKLGGRVNPIESDLYEHVPFKRYDLIVTNPPYVNSVSMGKLPPEYLREPQIALAGGEDGMDLVRKIVEGAAERLTPEGILVVEIGNERDYAEAAFGHLGLTWLTTSAGDDAVFLLTAEQLQSQ